MIRLTATTTREEERWTVQSLIDLKSRKYYKKKHPGALKDFEKD